MAKGEHAALGKARRHQGMGRTFPAWPDQTRSAGARRTDPAAFDMPDPANAKDAAPDADENGAIADQLGAFNRARAMYAANGDL